MEQGIMQCEIENILPKVTTHTVRARGNYSEHSELNKGIVSVIDEILPDLSGIPDLKKKKKKKKFPSNFIFYKSTLLSRFIHLIRP
jgi:hypothetical protein